MPELTPRDARGALDEKNNRWIANAFAGYGQTIEDALRYLQIHLEQNTDGEAEQILKASLDLNHLIKPPACTACPFFAQMDGVQFCGFAPCFDRKKIAEETAEIHKVSESTGIAILTADDGKHTELIRWNDKHKNYFDKKGPDLRLKFDHGYNTWEGIPNHMTVVVVGKTYAAWKKAEEQKKEVSEKDERERVSYELQRKINAIVEAQTELFAWEVATPIFEACLAGVTQVDFLECLLDNSDFYPSNVLPDTSGKELQAMKRASRLSLARRKIMFAMLFREIRTHEIAGKKTPTAALAKEFADTAAKWGVKLPKDFEKQAQAYDQAIELEIEKLNSKEFE